MSHTQQAQEKTDTVVLNEENTTTEHNDATSSPIVATCHAAVADSAVETALTKKSIELLTLPISMICIDGGTQSRVALNEATVADYVEAIRLGAVMPPVVVFKDEVSSGVWLADGFHRFTALKEAGATEINCEVRSGTSRDAILHSVGANASHGLRRTNEDKRKAVMTLLNDPDWATWSNEAIAKACNVSPRTVSAMRISANAEIDREQGQMPTPEVRTAERNGKIYKQNTSKIGKTKPTLQPQEQQVETTQASEPAGPGAMSEEPEGDLETAGDAVIKGKQKAPTDQAIDSDELETLRANVAALTEENATLRADQKEMIEEVAMMERVVTADDQIKASMDEAKRHKAIAENAERTLRAKNGDFIERAKQVIYWKNRATKAEKKLAKMQVAS